MSDPEQFGVVVGLVTDVDDPVRLGRVKVRFPQLADDLSPWARIVSPMAGSGRGMVFRPEVDDEVLVAFENGDMDYPYVLGGLWSRSDPPPEDDGRPGQNNWRLIRSRSGHVFKFDDTPGRERIEIIGKDGFCRVVIDGSADRIQITAETGDIELLAPAGTVKIDANHVDITSRTRLSFNTGTE